MIAIRTAGTKVTPVSFQEWKVKFEAEIKAVKKKEESDRIKAMPPKERDEYKKNAAKLSGRQLFARGGMEVGEEDVEDDVYSVDVSKYTRVEGLIQDEEELGLENRWEY